MHQENDAVHDIRLLRLLFIT